MRDAHCESDTFHGEQGRLLRDEVEDGLREDAAEVRGVEALELDADGQAALRAAVRQTHDESPSLLRFTPRLAAPAAPQAGLTACVRGRRPMR